MGFWVAGVGVGGSDKTFLRGTFPVTKGECFFGFHSMNIDWDGVCLMVAERESFSCRMLQKRIQRGCSALTKFDKR